MPMGWVGGLDEEVAAVWEVVTAGIKGIGFPDHDALLHQATTIVRAEACAVHRDWMEKYPDPYGEDVLQLLRLGLTVPAVDYVQAIRNIPQMRNEVEAAMDGVDAILLPATPFVAPFIGQTDASPHLPRFTRPFNLTGHPAISLLAPGASLPVGIQLVGHLNREDLLLAVAQALEGEWAQL